MIAGMMHCCWQWRVDTGIVCGCWRRPGSLASRVVAGLCVVIDIPRGRWQRVCNLLAPLVVTGILLLSSRVVIDIAHCCWQSCVIAGGPVSRVVVGIVSGCCNRALLLTSPVIAVIVRCCCRLVVLLASPVVAAIARCCYHRALLLASPVIVDISCYCYHRP